MDKKEAKKKGRKRYDYLIVWELDGPHTDFSRWPTLADLSEEITAKEREIVEEESKRREIHPMEKEGVEYRASDLQTIYFVALPRNERMLGKRQYVEGAFMSARDYIYERLEDRIGELIDEAFPSIIDRSKPTFKKEKKKYNGQTVYRMRNKIKAMGNEKLIEKLRRECFFSGWLKEEAIRLAEKFKGWTFVEEARDDWHIYIVGGMETAGKIRMEKLFRDFYTLEQPVAYIEKEVERSARKWAKKHIKRKK
jgi:hypothetical protein